MNGVAHDIINRVRKVNQSSAHKPMINTNIKGLRIELTDAIKDAVHTKTAPFEKFIKDDAYLYVQIGKQSAHHKSGPEEFVTEMTLDTYGHMYFVSIIDQDLYKGLEKASEEIINQIKQGRGKRQTVVRKGRMMLKQLTRKGFYGWNK